MRSFLFAVPLAAVLAVVARPAAADGVKPYVRATLGYDWSRDATFEDADCHSVDPAAYFGCGKGEGNKSTGARGDFGTSFMGGIGAGLELTDWFRIEAALEMRPGFAFDGNANFIAAGTKQPVSGGLDQADAMAFAYVEPLAAMGMDTRIRPFIGAGAGVSRNDVSQMTYDFPALQQPRYTLVPGGTDYDFAWAVTAGLGYAVSDRLTLEVAYRYSDFGKVETDKGPMFVQKHASSLTLPIGSTEADLVSQEVTMSARIGF